MAVNIGPRIGIEGEAEYRKQINNITQAQKTLAAEMKATEAAFDKNASAQEKNAAKSKNLQQQIENQKKKIEQLKRMTEQSAQKFGENSTQTLKWREALANAEAELSRLNNDLEKVSKNDFASKMQSAGEALQTLGGKMQSVGDWMTTHITQPLMDVGKYCTQAYKEVDSAMDIIVKKTGATGEELEDMKDTAKGIAKTIPVSFEKSAKAVGEVNTRFGATGDELEDLSTYFLEFAELNNTDVSQSVDDVSKSMRAFGVDTKDAKKVLDVMNATGQRTGISMTTLSSSMVRNAASLQEMGLDIYQATQFLGDLEMSGADTTVVMTGLRTAMANAAEEGKTLPEALSEFQTVMNSSATDQEKLNAAIELFGTKAGPTIYEACKNGSLSFEELDKSAEEHMGNVQTTYENTLGPDSALVTTMNSLKETGSEIGATLLTILEPAITSIGDYISKLGEWYSSLDETTQQTVSSVGIALAAGGPIIVGISRVITGLGTIITKAGEAGAKLGSLGGYAGPVGLTALSIGGAALAAKEFIEYADKVGHIPGFDEVMSQAEETAKRIQGLRDEIDILNSHAEGVAKGVNDQVAPVQYLQSELQKCFDADGHLNEGMEETAELIVGQLNEAMGTDLSTDFGQDMAANQQALEAVNGAVDDYIEKIRQAAVQQAFNEDYGNYIREEATAWSEARNAQAEYEAQLAACTETQNRMNELAEQFEGLNSWDDLTPDLEAAYAEYDQLFWVLQDQNAELEVLGENYRDASAAAAEASSSVSTLEEAQRMLLSPDPAERRKALDFYASIDQRATEAGKSVEKELGGAIDDTNKKLNAMTAEPYDLEVEFVNVEKETKKQRKTIDGILSNIKGVMTGISGVSNAANTAKAISVSILSGVTGRLTTIGNVTGAASGALSVANSVLSKITGRVSTINFADAVQSAWSSMQSWFNNNPLTSYVNQVVNTVSNAVTKITNPWGWANGGIVDKPTWGVFGEAGPEAFIPLSASKRGRAIDLYHQVGSILGVGSGGNMTNNTNNNHISINVYASANQSADEIAEIVSRKISAQVYSRKAVFT